MKVTEQYTIDVLLEVVLWGRIDIAAMISTSSTLFSPSDFANMAIAQATLFQMLQQ